MPASKLKASISIIVPIFNEEKTIAIVLKKLLKLSFVRQIVVVDDCSQDKSVLEVRKVKSNKITFLQHSKNQGKTQAVITALAQVKQSIIIIQDADLEYDPSEIQFVIDPILSGLADVVYGSRFLVKKATRVLYFYHYLANKFLTFFSNLLTNLNMSDIETCYKAFRTPILKEMPLCSKGFGMEVEITALIARLPFLRIYEIPISYYGRTYEEGKKISFKDGIMAIVYIFHFNLIAPYTKKRKEYFKKMKGGKFF